MLTVPVATITYYYLPRKSGQISRGPSQAALVAQILVAHCALTYSFAHIRSQGSGQINTGHSLAPQIFQNLKQLSMLSPAQKFQSTPWRFQKWSPQSYLPCWPPLLPMATPSSFLLKCSPGSRSVLPCATPSRCNIGTLTVLKATQLADNPILFYTRQNNNHVRCT